MTLKSDRIPADVAEAVYGEDWLEMSAHGDFEQEVTDWVDTVIDQAAERVEREKAATKDNPDAPYPIPHMEGDFESAPDLERLAAKLLDRHQDRIGFDVEDAFIRYAWKRKGGKSAGKPVDGKCVKLSGASAFFANGADYLIWLAADHNAGRTRGQIEALLFHELLHVQKSVDDEGNIAYGVRGHDLEMFEAEVEEYGLWHYGLESASQVFQQRLPGVE